MTKNTASVQNLERFYFCFKIAKEYKTQQLIPANGQSNNKIITASKYEHPGYIGLGGMGWSGYCLGWI
jgi:hypothetical protein